jgi:predicted ATPase/DNA-binding winged helix-turn-helix (wHTH) protein
MDEVTFTFGSFRLTPAQRVLFEDRQPLRLGSRAFDILVALVESAGETIAKEELIARAWPDTVVEEAALRVHVAALRKALGDGRAGKRYIANHVGRGYAFIAPVTRENTPSATAAPTGLAEGGSLPTPLTRVVGRDGVISRLAAQLVRRRFLTIAGPGGIGKTTVALAVADRVRAAYKDGVWFVGLASLTDPDLVPSAACAALRAPFSGGDHMRGLAAWLRGRNALLVLDNCEHVIGEATALAEAILQAAPQAGFLATSREPLRAEGEWLHRLAALELPPQARTSLTVAEALGYSAVELFSERATATTDSFVLDDAEVPAVLEICRRLDGVPLALELAAARVDTIGVHQLAALLDDRFGVLTSGRRTALPRQQTLRATIDWSYELLPELERRLLRHLAVFAGGFTLEAAAAVEGAAIADVPLIDSIASLVAKSLIVLEASTSPSCWSLLETTRAYALEKLTESGALAEVARRHAAYFLTTLETVGDEQRSKPRDEYLAVFRRRADEVHVALEWAFSATGDPAVGVALTIAAVPLWFELFQMPVARRRVEQALPHAKTDSDEEMRLRIAFGHAVWYTTPDSEALEPQFARALDIAERIGAATVRTQALWGLWAARRGRGDYPAALAFARRYAEAAGSTGDPGAIHLGNRILGLTHHILGQQQLARGFAERALRQPHLLDAASGIGFQIETPVAMGALLARVLWLSGFPDQAIEATADAMAAARKIGHPFVIPYAVTFAGLPVALWTGDMAEARRQLDLLVDHAGGVQRMEPRVRSFRRVLKLRAGDEREALIASFIESHWDPAHFPPFADLDVDADISVPLPCAKPVYVAWNTPEALRVDAELLLWHAAPGAVEAAEAKLLRALGIARVQSALSWELRSATSLARLWRRRGRATEARDLLAGIYCKFGEGFGTSDLIRARNMMTDLESDNPSA